MGKERAGRSPIANRPLIDHEPATHRLRTTFKTCCIYQGISMNEWNEWKDRPLWPQRIQVLARIYCQAESINTDWQYSPIWCRAAKETLFAIVTCWPRQGSLIGTLVLQSSTINVSGTSIRPCLLTCVSDQTWIVDGPSFERPVAIRPFWCVSSRLVRQFSVVKDNLSSYHNHLDQVFCRPVLQAM